MKYKIKTLTTIICLMFISTIGVSCIELPSADEVNDVIDNVTDGLQNDGNRSGGGRHCDYDLEEDENEYDDDSEFEEDSELDDGFLLYGKKHHHDEELDEEFDEGFDEETEYEDCGSDIDIDVDVDVDVDVESSP